MGGQGVGKGDGTSNAAADTERDSVGKHRVHQKMAIRDSGRRPQRRRTNRLLQDLRLRPKECPVQGAIGWSAKESRIVQTSQGQREKPTWSGKVNPKPKPMAATTEEPGMFLFQPRTAPPQASLIADPAASNDNSPRCPIPVKMKEHN